MRKNIMCNEWGKVAHSARDTNVAHALLVLQRASFVRYTQLFHTSYTMCYFVYFCLKSWQLISIFFHFPLVYIYTYRQVKKFNLQIIFILFQFGSNLQTYGRLQKYLNAIQNGKKLYILYHQTSTNWYPLLNTLKYLILLNQ